MVSADSEIEKAMTLNLKYGILGVLLLALLTGCATTTSPTGRRQYLALSDSQLDQMGARAFSEMKMQQPVGKDARQNAYVQCVVEALVKQLPTELRSVPWEVAVFVDDTPNAFALPGGKVGVHTGIFKVAENQDQLAAVLGHEIGHVYARHSNERASRQVATSTGIQVLGALAGVRYGQTGADLVTQGGGMAVQLGILLPFSRVQETEADDIGQRLMAQAGFDPRQAALLWQNMIAETAGSGRTPQLLSTHPDPQNRIQELQKAAPSLMPVYEAERRAGNVPQCGN